MCIRDRCRNGSGVPFSEEAAKEILSEEEIKVIVGEAVKAERLTYMTFDNLDVTEWNACLLYTSRCV